MMNKKIYNWLLLPVWLCLLAGMAGCSSEVVEDEGSLPSPDGGTYLNITARGVVIDTPANADDFEDYIQSIRVIGFNANNAIICNTLFKAEESGNTKQWTSADDDKITISNLLEEDTAVGTCTFYFIANEEGHNLTGQLTASTLTPSTLKTIPVTFTATEAQWKVSTPILMTGEIDCTIIPGKTVTMHVDLTRALAKAVIGGVTKSDVSVTPYSYRLTLFVPSSYTLFPSENLPSTTDGSVNIEWAGSDTNLAPCYFPEGSGIAVTDLSITADKTYSTLASSGALGDVSRNHEFTINLRLEEDPVQIGLAFEVQQWVGKDVIIPPFN